MSRYQDWLINHINANPDFIRPERYRNEVLSFLKEPLEDLCISRPKSRLNWGITLPFDENFVTYVWFDALINYISGIGFPDGKAFADFWPHAQHVIAKDILKPHGIYWPCMLKSAGIAPYQRLNVHGYWNINAGKMSKTVGNVVNPLELIDVYGLDAFRYFVLRDMVFGLDSEFSEEALISRINADLANDLGNLVSRSFTMVNKYFKGDLPEPNDILEMDEHLKRMAVELIDDYEVFMKELAFHKALMAIWKVMGEVNRYIDKTAPWALAKSDPDRLATVITYVVETIKIISVLIWPFMPGSSETIQDQLGFEKKGEALTLEDARNWGRIKPVRAMARPVALFPRIETEKNHTQRHKSKSENKKSEMKLRRDLISFDDFQKVDLRIGAIKEAFAIPKSRKLLKLTVDIGEDRTVVAGIAGDYDEKDLIGRQVVVVANLEPAKLMGVKSHGMLLAFGDESGLHLIAPDMETVPGTRVS
jgi:methionyl-tRNA synthetase